MDPSVWTIRDWMIYGPLFNAAAGLIFGLIVLILGVAKRQVRYGIYGFLVCLIGGTILGLFISFPALIFFCWLILRGVKQKPAAGAGADSPIET